MPDRMPSGIHHVSQHSIRCVCQPMARPQAVDDRGNVIENQNYLARFPLRNENAELRRTKTGELGGQNDAPFAGYGGDLKISGPIGDDALLASLRTNCDARQGHRVLTAEYDANHRRRAGFVTSDSRRGEHEAAEKHGVRHVSDGGAGRPVKSSRTFYCGSTEITRHGMSRTAWPT